MNGRTAVVMGSTDGIGVAIARTQRIPVAGHTTKPQCCARRPAIHDRCWVGSAVGQRFG